MNNRKLAELLEIDRTTLPADGGEQFNRLIFARSPYLLQHAENPVDWREWGEEAFAEARKRDLPLLVSIGYATCHWCHVMAAESFNDPEVASLMNELFVPIKVDREERPDLDEFYMTAARSLTGGGGWPLNVFIDHERRPFFAITYLPKTPRQRTPGFMDLLRNIATLWQERRGMIFNNAGEICRSLEAFAAVQPSAGTDLALLGQKGCRQLAELFDARFYGFGVSVKFPMPTYLLFLLSRSAAACPDAVSMACRTLEAMMNGGIHDQLGGGFHRYAVDPRWLVPHFEKMLYDQAMLIIAYCEGFRVCGDRRFLDTAARTAVFAHNELLTAGGGFCAALDADSEGEEGRFYTWSYAELTEILGRDHSPLLDYWGATAGGDLDGRCILRPLYQLDVFALEQGISATALQEMLTAATKRLLEERVKREAPLLDLKVICAWNGLMIAALVRLARASGEKKWLESAQRAARFILSAMVDPTGVLCRNWLATPSPVPAFAEDYALFCFGLTELVSSSPDPFWKETLEYFAGELSRHFVNDRGDVSFCRSDSERMLIAIAAVQDGVIPSTAGICAVVLKRAGLLLDNRLFTETGEKIITRYRGVAEQNPAACLTLVMAEEGLFLNY